MRQPTPYRRDNLWDFMSEVERAFDDFWRAPAVTAPRRSLDVFTPAVDLHETDDFYLVSLDLPGVPEKDIKIDVQNGRLTITGERQREERSETGLFKRYERAYGRFERAFQLPQDVNQEKIEARYENGVLEVLIPKAEVAKPRSVQISTGGEKTGLWSRLVGKTDETKSESDTH